MNFLITGGAGFIGSAVIRQLIDSSSDNILNIDRLTYAGNLENLYGVCGSPRYRFAQLDICDYTAMTRIFAQFQPDIVMHLAAETHVDRSINGPAEFIQTNLVGTFTLLEVARSYWQGLPDDRKDRFRFHHVSTDEVYGDLPHPDEDPEAAHRRFDENSAYAPSSPYSASKAGSDHLVRAWMRTYGLPTIISNCSNNYGPCQFPEKLIPLMLFNALAGKPLPVYGAGDQIRDWLYVEDHARALITVARAGIPGETYAIGGGNELRNRDLVTQLCELLQELRPSSARYADLITSVPDRPGHDRRYAIDNTKITRELQWQPQEDFHSGLRKTVQWYLKNSEWCERVRSGAYRRRPQEAT